MSDFFIKPILDFPLAWINNAKPNLVSGIQTVIAALAISVFSLLSAGLYAFYAIHYLKNKTITHQLPSSPAAKTIATIYTKTYPQTLPDPQKTLANIQKEPCHPIVADTPVTSTPASANSIHDKGVASPISSTKVSEDVQKEKEIDKNLFKLSDDVLSDLPSASSPNKQQAVPLIQPEETSQKPKHKPPKARTTENIFLAIENEKWSDITSFLKEDSTLIESRDFQNQTPLLIAAKFMKLKAAQKLLKHHASVDASDYIGMTALHFAAKNGDATLIKVLLKHHADKTATDNFGQTPLNLAISEHHLDAIKALCGPYDLNTIPDYQAVNILFKYDEAGRYPLHYAVEDGHLQTVNAVLECGADVESTDFLGNRPLHLAAKLGFTDIIKVLISRKAETSPQNIEGMTPMHLAVDNCKEESLKTLLNLKADINSADMNGRTPLHRAAQGGFLEGIKLLLKHGADTAALDNEQKSAYMLAVESHQEKAAKALAPKKVHFFAES